MHVLGDTTRAHITILAAAKYRQSKKDLFVCIVTRRYDAVGSMLHPIKFPVPNTHTHTHTNGTHIQTHKQIFCLTHQRITPLLCAKLPKRRGKRLIYIYTYIYGLVETSHTIISAKRRLTRKLCTTNTRSPHPPSL